MGSFQQNLESQTALDESDSSWLRELVHEWHLLADTSFSDLILWVPKKDPNVFLAVAQVRPTTGPTALEDEVVGEEISYEPESLVLEAFMSEEICQTSDNKLMAGIPVDIWAIPVFRHGKCIAVVERHTNRMGIRAPGALEDNYLEIADILTEMLHQGTYPVTPPNDASVAPRIGDGLTRVSPNGVISYASPNAVSAFWGLGHTADLEGEDFRRLVRTLSPSVDHVGQRFESDLDGSTVAEFELSAKRSVIRFRVVPLFGIESGQTSHELLVMTRNITELRAREQQLVTKDATIREIHHRVKNNLQTVAALLRLQARRADSADAKKALSDAMSRVQSIALVHEILSQSYVDDVEFDEVADRILKSVGDVAISNGEVHTKRTGSFGLVPATVATNLSLVITELCQNSAEHGLNSGTGNIELVADRGEQKLVVEVKDDGCGLPDGFDIGAQTSSLGLSIVQTLVGDTQGFVELTNRADRKGAVARIEIPTYNWDV